MFRRRAHGGSILLLLLLSLTANSAHADALCDFYRKSVPSMYRMVCGGGSGGNSSKPAGANSTFSDSFNISAAALPTEPSSYGIETIVSRIRGNGEIGPTFAIVKGFHKFGAGVSTGGNTTFYGNDVLQRLYGGSDVETYAPREEARGHITNLNLGTSLKLFQTKGGLTLRLGLSGRYNKITNSWGGGPALLTSYGPFTVGGGFTQERISNYLPRITFTSYLASMRLWIFELEYNQLRSSDHLGLRPIHIFTTTMMWRRLTLSYAIRHLNYRQLGSEQDISQSHYAVQYLFSKNFSAGFLYNYIPGSTSFGAQYYF